MSNITKVAKQLAEANPKLNKAYKYDLVMREFDNKIELIGLVDDPTYDIADFVGREMLFPKKWVTLDVFEPSTRVTV
jgi:hypothetical protein